MQFFEWMDDVMAIHNLSHAHKLTERLSERVFDIVLYIHRVPLFFPDKLKIAKRSEIGEKQNTW